MRSTLPQKVRRYRELAHEISDEEIRTEIVKREAEYDQRARAAFLTEYLQGR